MGKSLKELMDSMYGSLNPTALSCLPVYYAIADNLASHSPPFAKMQGYDWHDDGVPGKNRVAAYVLSDFARADQDWLDDLLRGIARGAPDLAAGDGPKFLNAIAQARPAPAKPAAAKKPDAPKPEPAPEDSRSPMQKLLDRFK